MAAYYPPVGFHFRVDFLDIQTVEDDIRFQSASGLNVDLDTEAVKEGGENRFTHNLPVRSKYSDLVLKRGVLTDSGVIAWCRNAFENFTFQPTTVQVHLLNASHEPLITWTLTHTWPLKWSVSDMNAAEGSVLVETLELSYQYFKKIRL